MKLTAVIKTLAVACGIAIAAGSTAHAATTITTFDSFTSDALYASWAAPGAVNSGPNSYAITATGYGSNYKYIGFPVINGAGNAQLQLAVSLAGPPAADGQLGPIVQLIDGDGTHRTYAWYGQPLGSRVLSTAIDSPTSQNAPGTTPGLDLNTLTHMHMELDPGSLGVSGAYTVTWENLALIVPEPSAGLLAACCGLAMAAIRHRRAA